LRTARKSKQLFAAVAGFAIAATGLLATTAEAVLPANTTPGVATITPASGTRTSTWGITLPPAASCPGDSATGNYLWYGYIVANNVDASQLTWAGGSPASAASPAAVVQPLYGPAGQVVGQTAIGSPAAVTIAGTAIDLSVYPANFIPAGLYKVGVACVLAGNTTEALWQSTINVAVNGAGVITGYTPFVAPGAPTVGPLTAGNGSLSGTLTAPTPAPTPAVSSYTITATPTVGAPVVITQPGLAFAFSGLTNGVTYSVTATAFNGGTSAPSAAQTGTPTDPNARPPVVLNPVVLGPLSATVSWTAPAITPNFGPFYNVVVTNTVTGLPAVGVTVGALTAASTSVSLTTLTAGASLTVSVTPVYTAPATSTPATTPAFIVLGNSLIIQDVNVTRPQGALVLTQVCGVYGALDGEPASAGFGALAAKSATVAAGGATGPTLGANGTGGVDPNYTGGLYPSPAIPTYPTHCNISLGTAALVTTGAEAGQYYAASGQINQVTVSDTRDGQNGWTLNGTMSQFVNSTNSSVTFGNNWMGWTPKVNGFSVGQVVTAAPRVLPNAPGLVAPTTLASATTASLGIAQMDARLRLLIPVSAPSGVYNATLTFSVA
jgi:hypothetical protein